MKRRKMVWRSASAATIRQWLPVLLLAVVLAAAGCSTSGGGKAESASQQVVTAPPDQAAPAAGGQTPETVEPPDDDLTPLERWWGVELIGVRRTAADHMLDVRYKVLDAAKAAPLFERGTKAVLIHDPTGAEIPVFTPAKTGPLRSTNPPLEGRTYFMFFGNPGGLVKMGDPVTLKIGEYEYSTSVE